MFPDSHQIIDSETLPSTRHKRRVVTFFWGVSKLVFVLLFVLFFISGLMALWLLNEQGNTTAIVTIITVLCASSGVGLLVLFYVTWRHLAQLSDDMGVWARALLKGDLSSRIADNRNEPSTEIRTLINRISDDYESLSAFEQQRFTREAERTEQKKYYLDVLYDVSRTINKSNNLEDLLQRFLHTVTKVVNAEAAMVKLLDKDQQMRLVASLGLSEEVIAVEDTPPSSDCLCAALPSDLASISKTTAKECGNLTGNSFFENDQDIEMLSVPLQYRDKVLGIYNLFVHRKAHDFFEGEHELLVSIGQHLGMAIEQAGVEEDAKTLSIIEERTRMAHELHDSLAQTLATLRIKVRLFDESLQNDKNVKNEKIWDELVALEGTIDNANAELRSLITHFRAPIDGKGIVRAAERLTERFKLETDADVFFYHNWQLKELSRDVEIEVIRIIQEALANVKKHAKAKNVRILMISTEDGQCSVLVEDDGVGIDQGIQNNQALDKERSMGEHIGLSVMQERAKRINGEIQFEDDDGEGTLVQLNFEIPQNTVSISVDHVSQ